MKTILARDPSQTAHEALVGEHRVCMWLGVGFLHTRRRAMTIMLLAGVFLFLPFAMMALAGFWRGFAFGVFAMALMGSVCAFAIWGITQSETLTFGIVHIGRRAVILRERSPSRVRHTVVSLNEIKLSTVHCFLEPGPFTADREAFALIAEADRGRLVIPLALRSTELECAQWHAASAMWSQLPLATSARRVQVCIREHWKRGAYPATIQESVIYQSLLGRDRDLRRLLSICGRCGYDLKGLPIAAPCPECGR